MLYRVCIVRILRSIYRRFRFVSRGVCGMDYGSMVRGIEVPRIRSYTCARWTLELSHPTVRYTATHRRVRATLVVTVYHCHDHSLLYRVHTAPARESHEKSVSLQSDSHVTLVSAKEGLCAKAQTSN